MDKMNEFSHVVVLILLMASTALQLFAALLSWRLFRFSRRYWSWLFLSTALLLMAVRRVVSFIHVFQMEGMHAGDVVSEIIALLVSLLLAAGLLSIEPLMKRLYGLMSAEDDAGKGFFCELFKKISSGVMVYESVDKGADFVIRDVNPASEKIEQCAREHLVGRRVTEAFPAVEQFGLLEVLQRVWRSGQPENFPLHYYSDGRISGWRDNYVYRRASGDVVAVYNDVSAQVHLREELERREKKFRLLYQYAPFPYQALSAEGVIEEVNPAWLGMTGLKRSDSIGRDFTELLPRPDRKRFTECLQKLFAEETLLKEEFQLRRADGKLVDIEMEAIAFCEEPVPAKQVFCTFYEKAVVDHGVKQVSEAELSVAEKLAAERSRLRTEKLSLLGELTAGMAQELNPSLEAARNAFALMKEDISPASRHYEFIDVAARELNRMSGFIERMYRFHEPVSQECESINLNAMIDNALLLVRPQIRERNLTIRDERAGKLPSVKLPPGAVMLVLLNPLKNSVEMLDAPGTLVLHTEASEEGVIVEIEDDGPGIPPEFIPRLFDPFTTLGTKQDGSRGVGLGMAIVQRTLNIMGGSVSVDSAPNSGTLVRMVFPFEMRRE